MLTDYYDILKKIRYKDGVVVYMVRNKSTNDEPTKKYIVLKLLNDKPIVEIIQRTLTNEPREDDGCLLLRRYKNVYLYERYMIMRAETGLLLTAFIEDSKIMARKE